MSKVKGVWIFFVLSSLISSISIYYVPESDIRLKTNEYLNFLRDFVAKLRASQYIIGQNRTSKSKVMTIWICIVLQCLISSISIYYAPESNIWVKCYDHLNLWRASVAQFWASRYIMRLNCTYEWKVKTIWIAQELPLFNFERLDMWCDRIGPPSKKLWPFEFLESLRRSISSVWYIMRLNLTSVWKFMTI